MTDFHHNIFYYYRGAKRPDQEHNSQQNQKWDPQLEDNTTKALINTLEHCSPVVTRKLLEWLNITATDKPKFELQKMTIGERNIRRKSQRLLLGLVQKEGEDSICDRLEGPVDGDSRPDAWIYGEDYVVLIESKVGRTTSLDLNQMRCHSQKLQAGTQQLPRCKVRTWAKVHQFFVGILPELKGQNKWLVEQFTQYLEWKGMTDFTGFEEEMFDFFAHTDRDADTKQWVRDTMQSFAKKVLSRLKLFDDSYYQGYHVGNLGLKDDHCWVAFFGPNNQKFRDWAHQTISIYDYGLEVLVNVELKPVIDKLRKKINQDNRAFRETISKLPEPFSVQIEERKKIGPRRYDYYHIARLEGGVYKDPDPQPYGLKDPKSKGFDYIEPLLLKQIKLPYLSVRRRIDKKQVLELSKGEGDALVNCVVDVMKAFHPVVRYING